MKLVCTQLWWQTHGVNIIFWQIVQGRQLPTNAVSTHLTLWALYYPKHANTNTINNINGNTSGHEHFHYMLVQVNYWNAPTINSANRFGSVFWSRLDWLQTCHCTSWGYFTCFCSFYYPARLFYSLVVLADQDCCRVLYCPCQSHKNHTSRTISKAPLGPTILQKNKCWQNFQNFDIDMVPKYQLLWHVYLCPEVKLCLFTNPDHRSWVSMRLKWFH